MAENSIDPKQIQAINTLLSRTAQSVQGLNNHLQATARAFGQIQKGANNLNVEPILSGAEIAALGLGDALDDLEDSADEGEKKLKKLKKGLDTFRGGVKDSSNDLAQLESSISDFGNVAAFAGVSVGIKFTSEQFLNLENQIIQTSNSLSKYGISVSEVEDKSREMSDALSVTQQEALELFQTFEKGLPINSLESARRILQNVRNVTGSNKGALQEMSQAVADLAAEYPLVQSKLENLNDSNKAYLRSIISQQVAIGKMSEMQSRMLRDYIDQNSQVTEQDSERAKQLKENSRIQGEINKKFEELSVIIGKTILPLLKNMISFYEDNSLYIQTISKFLASWAPYIAMAVALASSLAVILGTIAAALGTIVTSMMLYSNFMTAGVGLGTRLQSIWMAITGNIAGANALIKEQIALNLTNAQAASKQSAAAGVGASTSGTTGKGGIKGALGLGALGAVVAVGGEMLSDATKGYEDTNEYGKAAAGQGAGSVMTAGGSALAGGTIGSMILPGIGTAIGAALGAGIGAWFAQDDFFSAFDNLRKWWYKEATMREKGVEALDNYTKALKDSEDAQRKAQEEAMKAQKEAEERLKTFLKGDISSYIQAKQAGVAAMQQEQQGTAFANITIDPSKDIAAQTDEALQQIKDTISQKRESILEGKLAEQVKSSENFLSKINKLREEEGLTEQEALEKFLKTDEAEKFVEFEEGENKMKTMNALLKISKKRIEEANESLKDNEGFQKTQKDAEALRERIADLKKLDQEEIRALEEQRKVIEKVAEVRESEVNLIEAQVDSLARLGFFINKNNEKSQDNVNLIEASNRFIDERVKKQARLKVLQDELEKAQDKLNNDAGDADNINKNILETRREIKSVQSDLNSLNTKTVDLVKKEFEVAQKLVEARQQLTSSQASYTDAIIDARTEFAGALDDSSVMNEIMQANVDTIKSLRTEQKLLGELVDKMSASYDKISQIMEKMKDGVTEAQNKEIQKDLREILDAENLEAVFKVRLKQEGEFQGDSEGLNEEAAKRAQEFADNLANQKVSSTELMSILSSILDARSKQEGIESRITDQILVINKAFDKQRNLLQSETALSEKLVSLYDNMAVGVKASAEMRMQVVRNMQEELKLNEKNIDALEEQIALADTEKERIRLQTELNKKVGDQLEIQQKIASTTKTLRDGWIDAIQAISTGSGRINKVMYDQDKFLAQSQERLGAVRGMATGAVAREGETALGFRRSERFTSVFGQLSGRFAGETPYRTDMGMKYNLPTAGEAERAAMGGRDAAMRAGRELLNRKQQQAADSARGTALAYGANQVAADAFAAAESEEVNRQNTQQARDLTKSQQEQAKKGMVGGKDIGKIASGTGMASIEKREQAEEVQKRLAMSEKELAAERNTLLEKNNELLKQIKDSFNVQVKPVQVETKAIGGVLRGPSHAQGGIQAISRSGVPIAEVEGGEYVVNASSTKKYMPLLESINQDTVPKKFLPKMQDGGVLPNYDANQVRNLTRKDVDKRKISSLLNNTDSLINTFINSTMKLLDNFNASPLNVLNRPRNIIVEDSFKEALGRPLSYLHRFFHENHLKFDGNNFKFDLSHMPRFDKDHSEFYQHPVVGEFFSQFDKSKSVFKTIDDNLEYFTKTYFEGFDQKEGFVDLEWWKEGGGFSKFHKFTSSLQDFSQELFYFQNNHMDKLKNNFRKSLRDFNPVTQEAKTSKKLEDYRAIEQQRLKDGLTPDQFEKRKKLIKEIQKSKIKEGYAKSFFDIDESVDKDAVKKIQKQSEEYAKEQQKLSPKMYYDRKIDQVVTPDYPLVPDPKTTEEYEKYIYPDGKVYKDGPRFFREGQGYVSDVTTDSNVAEVQSELAAKKMQKKYGGSIGVINKFINSLYNTLDTTFGQNKMDDLEEDDPEYENMYNARVSIQRIISSLNQIKDIKKSGSDKSIKSHVQSINEHKEHYVQDLKELSEYGPEIANIVSKQLDNYLAALPQYKQGGRLEGPSHSQGGIPIMAEGGEAILPRQTTYANGGLIDTMLANPGKNIFEDGGVVGSSSNPFTGSSNVSTNNGGVFVSIGDIPVQVQAPANDDAVSSETLEKVVENVSGAIRGAWQSKARRNTVE